MLKFCLVVCVCRRGPSLARGMVHASIYRTGGPGHFGMLHGTAGAEAVSDLWMVQGSLCCYAHVLLRQVQSDIISFLLQALGYIHTPQHVFFFVYSGFMHPQNGEKTQYRFSFSISTRICT